MSVADLSAVLSGGLIGLMLGIVGGGGSILAVPLLLYVVGVRNPHLAIGTSAVAVSANAFAGLGAHAKAGTVKWPCGVTFALVGAAGAFLGATLGRMIDGSHLLVLFAAMMASIAIFMLRPKAAAGNPAVHLNQSIAVRLVPVALGTGLMAGFFGIGGGFLIVPGLMLASGMPLLNAIGSSLVSVGVFGLTTAANYSLADLVDWRIALELLAGGALGSLAGQRLATHLAKDRQLLGRVFASVLLVVAGYMASRELHLIG